MSLSTLPPNRTVAPYGDGPMAADPIPVVSLRDIVRAIFRHKLPIVLIVAVAVFGAFGYLLFTTASYTAQTKLLVRVGREKMAPLAVGSEPTNNFVFAERVENVNDEIEILRNPAMMAQVYPALKTRYLEILAASRDYPTPVSVLDWVRLAVRETRQGLSDGVAWTLRMAREPLYFLGLSQRMTEDEQLGALLLASLAVDFVKETNVIVLSFSWSDPNYAAFALNTFAEAYRREHVRILSDVTGAVEFYTAQIARTETELAAANQAVDTFLAASAVTDPASEKQMTLNLVGTLEHQMSDAQVAEQQTRARLLAYQRKFDETDEWLETPGVANMTLTGLTDIDVRHTEMLTRRNAMLATLRPTAREVRDVDGEIAKLRRDKLRALLNYFNDRLAGELDVQRVVAERLTEQRARLERLNGIATRTVSLVDRRDQVLAQLKAYRKQVEDLGIRQALNDRGFASVAVLNEATPPDRPSAPRKGLILGLAAAFGVLFAVAYVILAEFFNQSFAGERDVARVLGLRLVASVPHLDLPARAAPRRLQ